MDILKALRAGIDVCGSSGCGAARQQLETVRAAIKLLSSKNGRMRTMSASSRAKIARAQKARWKVPVIYRCDSEAMQNPEGPFSNQLRGYCGATQTRHRES